MRRCECFETFLFFSGHGHLRVIWRLKRFNILLTSLFSLVAPEIKGLKLWTIKCPWNVPMTYDKKNIIYCDDWKLTSKIEGVIWNKRGYLETSLRLPPWVTWTGEGVIWNCYIAYDTTLDQRKTNIDSTSCVCWAGIMRSPNFRLVMIPCSDACNVTYLRVTSFIYSCHVRIKSFF